MERFVIVGLLMAAAGLGCAGGGGSEEDAGVSACTAGGGSCVAGLVAECPDASRVPSELSCGAQTVEQTCCVPREDAGTSTDGGVAHDGGSLDAGEDDGGEGDAGTADGGASDAGELDGGALSECESLGGTCVPGLVSSCPLSGQEPTPLSCGDTPIENTCCAVILDADGGDR